MLTGTMQMSERFACKVVGLARSAYRRLPLAQTPDDPEGLLHDRVTVSVTQPVRLVWS